MPIYTYQCKKCNNNFEVKMTFSEYAKGVLLSCPHCHSDQVDRTYESFAILDNMRSGFGSSGGCPPSSGPGCCG